MTKDSKSTIKKLGIRQRRTRFVKEYLKDKNATRAAKAAGYSEKSAHVLGCRLLKDPNVRSQIESSLEKVNAKLDISVERVIEELGRLAFFDPLEFWNEDGTAKPLHEISEDARRAIAGLEVAELFVGASSRSALSTDVFSTLAQFFFVHDRSEDKKGSLDLLLRSRH